MDGAPEQQKNTLPVLVQKNWALLLLDRQAEVRKNVDRALAAVRTPELLLQDAYLKIRQKSYASARASLTEALQKAPEDLRVLRMIVGSYASEKQIPAAVRWIQDHAAQHSKSAPVQQFLAEVLLANGQPVQARAALLAAKAANPVSTAPDLTLARLDLAEGHLDSAMQQINGVLVRNPDNLAARTLLAGLEDQRGNRAAAIAAYKKVLDLQPTNVTRLNNLAYDLAEFGNQPDEGLKYAQRAAKLAPNAPAVENTLGWTLYRRGLYSMALPHLEKAAQKEPSALRKYHVAMAYLKMGDQDRGQQNLEAARKLDPNLPELRTAFQVLFEMQGNGR